MHSFIGGFPGAKASFWRMQTVRMESSDSAKRKIKCAFVKMGKRMDNLKAEMSNGRSAVGEP